MRSPLAWLVSGAIVLAAALAGCGGEPAPPARGGAGRKITICLLPKKKGLPYFTSCAAGALDAAEELKDVTLVYDGPTDGSP